MTTGIATINMEVFKQSKEIVEYLKEAKALPWLVQNEGQLAMVMWSFAEMWVSPAEGISALWSAHAKKWTLPDTMMVIQQGNNCGLRPQESVAGMYPVNWTVTTFGATTNKLLVKAGYRIKVLQYTSDVCEISLSHTDQGELGVVKFTKDDAIRAKLRGKAGTWTYYPQDMLYWKCVARVLKMYAPDAIGGMQIFEDVKEALHVGDIDLSEDNALDGFAPSQERPKGAVQLGHVIPKWYTNTWPVDENLDPIVDEANVVHVDPEAVAEEIAEQQETAVTTTAEWVMEDVPEETKEDAVDKFKKKYGVKKKATVEEQMTAFPDAVAEDGGQLLDEETAGNMAEVIVDAIVESDEVEDNVDDTADPSKI